MGRGTGYGGHRQEAVAQGPEAADRGGGSKGLTKLERKKTGGRWGFKVGRRGGRGWGLGWLGSVRDREQTESGQSQVQRAERMRISSGQRGESKQMARVGKGHQEEGGEEGRSDEGIREGQGGRGGCAGVHSSWTKWKMRDGGSCPQLCGCGFPGGFENFNPPP